MPRQDSTSCHSGAVEHLHLSDEQAQRITVHPLEVEDTFETNGAKITALAANHAMPDNEQALHYIIEKDEKKLFYGCDGGWLRSQTWSFLRQQVLDCMILECTVGDHADDFRIGGHNTLPMVGLLSSAIRSNGILTVNGIIMASHLGNMLHDYLPHEEIAKKFAAIGVTAACDGMKVEI